MVNKNNHYREREASARCGNVLNVDGSSRIQTRIIINGLTIWEIIGGGIYKRMERNVR